MKKIVCGLICLCGFVIAADNCDIKEDVAYPEEETTLQLDSVCVKGELYYGTYRDSEKDIVDIHPAITYDNRGLPVQKKCTCPDVNLVETKK